MDNDNESARDWAERLSRRYARQMAVIGPMALVVGVVIGALVVAIL